MSRPALSVIKMPPNDSVLGNNLSETSVGKVTQRVVLFPKQSTAGSQLVWRGGCLQSILSDVSSQNDHYVIGQPSISVEENSQRKTIDKASFENKPFPLSMPIIWNQSQQDTAGEITYNLDPKGRNLKRSRDDFNPNNPESDSESSEGKSSAKVRATKPRNRGQTKRSSRKNPKPVQPLLINLRAFHPPGNLLLPALDLISKFDGLASFEAEKLVTNTAFSGLPTISEENVEEASTTANSSSAPTTGRMKSSAGINDIDFEEFKHYRRLNGYSLFVHVNKKKYESFPGSTPIDDINDSNDNQTGLSATGSGKDNQKSSNRRWQALWLTMPEKVKREWKNKAKRLLKQIEQHGKREVFSEDRKIKERDRLEVQLGRTQTTSYSLLDLAAHFQLLSDRFSVFSKNVNDYEGPIDPVGVESLLLDGILTCLIPLIALAGELETFSEVPDRKTICDALTNLTFIAPF
ncbi:unnamed protein product [Heterobilharzia americana]|nr:unnamed protein product [Heterobilharzia americana]